MRRKRKGYEGFTLVEVVVSMLILSIIVVSVLTAYTTSAQSNVKTKKVQSAETLFESIMEFTTAGGGDEAKSPYDGYFTPTSSSTVKDPVVPNVTVYNLEGVQQGLYSYNVKITKDTNSAKYKDSINSKEVISLGVGGKRSLMINMSAKASKTIDEDMLSYYYGIYEGIADAVNNNIPESGTKFIKQSKDAFKDMISRQIQIKREEVENPSDPSDKSKFKLNTYVVYKFDTSKLSVNVSVDGLVGTTTSDQKFLMKDSDGNDITEQRKMIATSEEFSKYKEIQPESDITLKNVYILYSKSEITKASTSCEILINDNDLDIGANFFVVLQDGTGKTANAIVNASKKDGGYSEEEMLNSRITSEKVKVTYSYDSTKTVPNGYKVGVYSSGLLDGVGNSWLKYHSNKLVATQEQARVVEVIVEVLDTSGNVLKKGEVVYLK